jgi:PEP-CTERM motif-containing protein
MSWMWSIVSLFAFAALIAGPATATTVTETQPWGALFNVGATSDLDFPADLLISAVEVRLNVPNQPEGPVSGAVTPHFDLTSPNPTVSSDFSDMNIWVALSGFAGENSLGTWTLRRLDNTQALPPGSDPLDLEIYLKSWDLRITGIPEPGTYALVGLGLLGVICLTRRRRAK